MRIFWILIFNSALALEPTGFGTPVYDTNKLFIENNTAMSYMYQIQLYVAQISKTVDLVSQLAGLKKLITAQDNLNNLCPISCSSGEVQQLQEYLTSVNDSIVNQFRLYLNGVDNNLQSLADIINLVQIENSNTEEIEISLQKASEETLVQMEATLLHVSTELTLNSHKKQIELQIEKANSDAIYRGFAKAGL